MTTTFSPLPGWAIVRMVETDERFPGSRIVIPDSVRDRVARNQAEVVAVSDRGGECEAESCEWTHEDGYHVVPETLCPGAWVLLESRSLVPIPGVDDQYLVPIDLVVGCFTETL